MNYLRQVEVAPGITMDAKDLVRDTGTWQVVVHHFVAGNAVLTRCTDNGEKFWEIETSFDDDGIRLISRLPQGQRMAEIDDALAYLVLLGAEYMARNRVLALTKVAKGMFGR